MAPVIEARNLGVRFHRNRRRHRQLREMLFKGKTGTPPGDFWAVNDASFEVQAGETVGLVGANGSGKSTLLKLVAGVLLPDTGSVEVRGGVAPLIELTGGFVADLSARDNIQITAGLHGMSRKQIAARFDEIVDFAEIEEFIDTPFRHFSSGMKVRLGFAVITQLDEPILLVDEVLAVGDRRFKEKCYDKLDTMIGEGRTVFMVSHSEADLQRFCKRGLYMNHGNLLLDGTLEQTLEAYTADSDAGQA